MTLAGPVPLHLHHECIATRSGLCFIVSSGKPFYSQTSRSMNGILEMEGFKETFKSLYNKGSTSPDNTTSMTDGINTTGDTTTMSNDTFITGGNICSSGNGASSDVLIVSLDIIRVTNCTPHRPLLTFAILYAWHSYRVWLWLLPVWGLFLVL